MLYPTASVATVKNRSYSAIQQPETVPDAETAVSSVPEYVSSHEKMALLVPPEGTAPHGAGPAELTVPMASCPPLTSPAQLLARTE